MKRFNFALPDDLYDAVLAAVESDDEENVSRFLRAAVRAELARRKKGKKA
jgi:Arc/MetJ-type ribon-helix-helix transcriptional regulator